jgi:hypothetical protein
LNTDADINDQNTVFSFWAAKYLPYPPRTTVLSFSEYAKPSRGAMLFLSSGVGLVMNGW